MNPTEPSLLSLADNPIGLAVILSFVLLCGAVLLAPCVIALGRKARRGDAIFALLACAWFAAYFHVLTGLALWLAALAWSVGCEGRPRRDLELERNP